MLYPQNSDWIVATDSVTSRHPMHIRMFLICLHHSLLVLTSETLQNDPSPTANNGHYVHTEAFDAADSELATYISSCRFHAGGFRNRDCCKLHLMSEINVANLHRKNENTEITFFTSMLCVALLANTRNTSCWETKCHPPSCDISTEGSSYLNVARTTVLHTLCRMANH